MAGGPHLEADRAGVRRDVARQGERAARLPGPEPAVFWLLSAPRAHTKAPYKMDLHRKTRRALDRPWAAPTVAWTSKSRIAAAEGTCEESTLLYVSHTTPHTTLHLNKNGEAIR